MSLLGKSAFYCAQLISNALGALIRFVFAQMTITEMHSSFARRIHTSYVHRINVVDELTS